MRNMCFKCNIQFSFYMLVRRLVKMNIIEEVQRQISNTAWTLAFITSIQYNVVLTDFPIWKNNQVLPNFIPAKKIIITFDINHNTKLAYYDILCFLDVHAIILIMSNLSMHISFNGIEIKRIH